MGLKGNLVEAREVGPTLVLGHVVADLVVIVHLHQEKRFCYIANNMRATAIIAYIVLYSESHTLYSKYSAI